MFPFVTGVEEVRQARAMFAAIAPRAGRDSRRHRSGAMIEVPAAALAADLLAPEVDFLTIGTNDLIQYSLAVDRTDDRVSDLYEPLHPAVLRLIRLVRPRRARASACRSRCAARWRPTRRWSGCLIGLGLTEFSMTPARFRLVRQVVARSARRRCAPRWRVTR